MFVSVFVKTYQDLPQQHCQGLCLWVLKIQLWIQISDCLKIICLLIMHAHLPEQLTHHSDYSHHSDGDV